MFKQLLVSLDGASEAEAALQTAGALARPLDARISLVRVIDGQPGSGHEADAYLAWAASEPTVSERIGARIVSALPAHGNVADTILETARQQGADMIVMATHGRGGLDRLLIGSVAQRVVERSPIPVLLQRPGAAGLPGLNTLLAPVDGTPGALVTLGLATALAQTCHARLVLVQAVTPFRDYLVEAGAGYDSLAYIDPAWEEEARRAAQGYVDGLAARLQALGVNAEGRVVAAHPATGINQVAAEVDANVIVMATRGLTGIRRAVMGSVADAVVRTANRPVLLMHRGSETDANLPAPVSQREPAGIKAT